MTTEMKDSTQPLFTFGIIADIQYADIDDGFNFKHTRKRYYRNSIRLLRNALERWNTENVKPLFILQLGDIIDGFNKRYNMSDQSLNTVMKEFDSSPAEVHHVWGNHEFYNFSRDTLLRSVLNSSVDFDSGGGLPSTGDIYAYHFSPAPGYRFILLDAYDVSLLGREESSVQYHQAITLLKAHNKNEDLNHPPALTGLEKRFVKFNGGFSQDQLDWLEGVLSSADHKLERVTIVSESSYEAISLSTPALQILSALLGTTMSCSPLSRAIRVWSVSWQDMTTMEGFTLITLECTTSHWRGL
ncbi:manganese-dependent ADP-ribose/CDP-alcohol diphosphatase isoform X2 [Esox lucius]|uniref:manganese-dependent ADP-ribose/CDP-alcohol diphosphatase isoform X2 n=1 Tax=Esox lucius TaxID=8010 RepID=UPI000661E142|nr:manganese-dependent ADP-ribose/CDP-alcohol diphosphatase isoform X2 [Esox lucius]